MGRVVHVGRNARFERRGAGPGRGAILIRRWRTERLNPSYTVGLFIARRSETLVSSTTLELHPHSAVAAEIVGRTAVDPHKRTATAARLFRCRGFNHYSPC